MNTVRTREQPPENRHGRLAGGLTLCAAETRRTSPPAKWTRRIASLHRDQQGTMSIVTVFTVLLLTMVLGMVMNVGREVDSKIRLQNAADAAAYSGGVVIARGMNTLAFTNHLLCEVIGLTAYMREARDRNAEKYVPSILAAWNEMAPGFTSSKYARLRALANAIPQKTPLEQELVRTFSDWGEAASEPTLPFVEAILEQELIPKFQRAVVETYPDIAQRAAMEAAQDNTDSRRREMLGVLWHTSGVPVAYQSQLVDRTLPVVDPELDTLPGQAAYFDTAKRERYRWSRYHLRQWNARSLYFFDHEAKMSQFANLWRTFSEGYVKKIIEEEYPSTNLPFVIRERPALESEYNAYLDENFTFVAVAYWRQPSRYLPGLFHNPTGADAEAFAEVRVILPHSRLVWLPPSSRPRSQIGGMPGDFPVDLPSDDLADESTQQRRHHIGRQSVPTEWSLFSQNWTVQLVPATAENLATILQTVPPIPEFAEQDLRLPRLGGLSSRDIQRINTH